MTDGNLNTHTDALTDVENFCAGTKSCNTSLLLELSWYFLKSCSSTGHGPANRSFPSSSCQRCTYPAPWRGGNVMLSRVWGRLFPSLCSCLSCPDSMKQMLRFLRLPGKINTVSKPYQNQNYGKINRAWVKKEEGCNSFWQQWAGKLCAQCWALLQVRIFSASHQKLLWTIDIIFERIWKKIGQSKVHFNFPTCILTLIWQA